MNLAEQLRDMQAWIKLIYTVPVKQDITVLGPDVPYQGPKYDIQTFLEDLKAQPGNEHLHEDIDCILRLWETCNRGLSTLPVLAKCLGDLANRIEAVE